jgi:lycopene beta-cyclase
MKHYHYIFTGSGLAALMTVYKMAVSGKFNDTSILLIDADTKKTNDRTWCFWEEGAGRWDEIVCKKWKSALFANERFTKELDFGNYQYKMVQGLDFYNYVFATLSQHPNIEFVNAGVIDFSDSGRQVLVKTESGNYTCNKLFNSIYNPASVQDNSKYPVLQQHFVGWHIKTSSPAFNEGRATFMDFSVPQKGNTRFMYVLPTSASEALVEYTLFSQHLLPLQEYEDAIKSYLDAKKITGYEIMYTEKGSIPMTVYPFWKTNTHNIINIGTAGGWTKASTGYTFKNADKKSDALIVFLITGSDFTKFYKKSRFWFYDLLLLDILHRQNEKGAAIFSSMFEAGKASLIFKFLDEETTFAEDIQVILKCPKRLFVKALIRNLINL